MTGRNKETTKPRPIKNKRVHRFAANQPANALIANRRDPNTKHRKQLQKKTQKTKGNNKQGALSKALYPPKTKTPEKRIKHMESRRRRKDNN